MASFPPPTPNDWAVTLCSCCAAPNGCSGCCYGAFPVRVDKAGRRMVYTRRRAQASGAAAASSASWSMSCRTRPSQRRALLETRACPVVAASLHASRSSTQAASRPCSIMSSTRPCSGAPPLCVSRVREVVTCALSFADCFARPISSSRRRSTRPSARSCTRPAFRSRRAATFACRGAPFRGCPFRSLTRCPLQVLRRLLPLPDGQRRAALLNLPRSFRPVLSRSPTPL